MKWLADHSEIHFESCRQYHVEGEKELELKSGEWSNLFLNRYLALGKMIKMPKRAPETPEPAPNGSSIVTARVVTEIMNERLRQKTEKGYTPEHDDQYQENQLARAAGCYALEEKFDDFWPWKDGAWKPEVSTRETFIKAAALMVAHIELMDRQTRAEVKHSTESGPIDSDPMF